MRARVFFAAALAIGHGPAFAKAELNPVGETPLVVEGGAGVKQEVEGFAVWVGGLPCCRIEVLGTINDDKRYVQLSKTPPASKEIVKLAREAGGNALIAINESMSSTNAETVSAKLEERRGAFSMSQDDGTDKTPTTFVVIKHSGAAN